MLDEKALTGCTTWISSVVHTGYYHTKFKYENIIHIWEQKYFAGMISNWARMLYINVCLAHEALTLKQETDAYLK